MLDELLFEQEDTTLLKTVIENSEYNLYNKKLKEYIEIHKEQDLNLVELILDFCEEELLTPDALAPVIKKDKEFSEELLQNCKQKFLFR